MLLFMCCKDKTCSFVVIFDVLDDDVVFFLSQITDSGGIEVGRWAVVPPENVTCNGKEYLSNQNTSKHTRKEASFVCEL